MHVSCQSKKFLSKQTLRVLDLGIEHPCGGAERQVVAARGTGVRLGGHRRDNDHSARKAAVRADVALFEPFSPGTTQNAWANRAPGAVPGR